MGNIGRPSPRSLRYRFKAPQPTDQTRPPEPRDRSSTAGLLGLLQCQFRLKARAITAYRGDSGDAAIANKTDGGVSGVKRPDHFNAVPFVRMANVTDCDVEMLTPEKRHRLE